MKSLEKEIIDAKNGKFVNGQPNNKRRTDKKRENGAQKENNPNAGSDVDEDMVLGDREEIGP